MYLGECSSCMPGSSSNDSGVCYECKRGTWGQKCQNLCHCRDPGENCSPDIGHCVSGCPTGYGMAGCQHELPSLANSSIPIVTHWTENKITLSFVHEALMNSNLTYIVMIRDVNKNLYHTIKNVATAYEQNNGCSITFTFTYDTEQRHELTVLPMDLSVNLTGLPSPSIYINTVVLQMNNYHMAWIVVGCLSCAMACVYWSCCITAMMKPKQTGNIIKRRSRMSTHRVDPQSLPTE